MTIICRDDDVLIGSSEYSDPLEKFKQVHSWICEVPKEKLLHVPAILLYHERATGAPGIIDIPGAVEFVREETQEGRMRPEIHGYEHVDYGKLDKDTVIDHLQRCDDFIYKEFGVVPTTWYTPWGASQPHLHEAAEDAGLKLVDCSKIHKLRGRHGVVQRLRDGEDLSFLENDEIFMHWWEGGLRLKRVIEVIKHGSWDKAVEENPQIDWV